MATTVQQIIDEARRTYPDLDSGRALQLVNQVDEEVLLHIPLRRQTIAGPFVVAGQGTYALDETVLKIWSVVWSDSSSSSHQLQETAFDALDVGSPNWRTMLGRPKSFYTTVDSSQGLIGFYPVPNVSASGGYPAFAMDCSVRVALSVTDSLPLVPWVRRLYTNGVRFLHALDRGKQDLQLWKALYDEDLVQQAEVFMQRAGRVQPQMRFVNQRSNWRRGGFRS